MRLLLKKRHMVETEHFFSELDELNEKHSLKYHTPIPTALAPISHVPPFQLPKPKRNANSFLRDPDSIWEHLF